METSTLQNFTNVSGITDQMNRDFIETRTKCNARKSLAWDSAFFTSPGVFEPEELLQALNSKKCVNPFRILGKEEETLLSSQNLEPENWRETGNFSNRKSLAWDNAFFTEEGVLDPEELSIVNRGFKRYATQLPPGMNEKLWRSTESSFTVEREGSTLTSLERDLFEDIRRSMPVLNSSKKICASSLKLGRGAASKNLDVRSKTKAKAVSSSRRQNTTAYGSSKGSPFPQPTKLKFGAGNGEYYTPSNLKPPRPVERAKYISTPSAKRPPDGHGIKINNRTGKASSAQHLNGSKKPCFRNPSNPIFSSLPLLKGCLSSSLTDMHETALWSPKSPSVTPVKSSKKMNTRSTMGTPLRNTRAKKMEVENFCHTPLSSTLKSSSSLSPASSVDKWSSRSSTSATKSSCSHKTTLAKQCEKVLMELDLDSHPGGRGNSRIQAGKKCMIGHESPSDLSQKIRPSNLRMPSPTIGYFDPENVQFGTIEGELEIWSHVDPGRPRPEKLESQIKGEKSPAIAMRVRQSYPSQKVTCDDIFSFTGQNLSSGAKAGGRKSLLRRKVKKNSKEKSMKCVENDLQIVEDGNKENMFSSEDPVEILRREIRVLDINN